jgi:cbb3-type cytochrome oxidase subunit 3
MFWLVLGILILFILYVIYSLSTIKNQLKQISKHLNVKDDIERVSNEEIEKELEDNIKM